MQDNAQTPIAFVQAIIDAYCRAGRSPDAAVRAAGIRRSDLQDSTSRVTAGQLERFSSFAMRELDDEALGWFSRPLPWGTYGMLCRASLPSPNLRVAMERWCRHFGLVAPDIRVGLDLQGATARIVIDEWTDLGARREFCLISMLRHAHGLMCWLADRRVGLVGASFPFAAPDHAASYRLMFGPSISFSAKRAGIAFDARTLELPMVRCDEDLRLLLERPLPLMVLQYRPDRMIARQVRNLLRGGGRDRLTADVIASALNLSVRSLHRYLATEGVSLRALKADVRRELAVEHLTKGHKPLKQVAAHAGYRSKAGFLRAFRQWTGQSPTDFRTQCAGSPAARGAP